MGTGEKLGGKMRKEIQRSSSAAGENHHGKISDPFGCGLDSISIE